MIMYIVYQHPPTRHHFTAHHHHHLHLRRCRCRCRHCCCRCQSVDSVGRGRRTQQAVDFIWFIYLQRFESNGLVWVLFGNFGRGRAHKGKHRTYTYREWLEKGSSRSGQQQQPLLLIVIDIVISYCYIYNMQLYYYGWGEFKRERAMMRRVLFLAGRVAGATKEERQLNLGVGGWWWLNHWLSLDIVIKVVPMACGVFKMDKNWRSLIIVNWNVYCVCIGISMHFNCRAWLVGGWTTVYRSSNKYKLRIKSLSNQLVIQAHSTLVAHSIRSIF